MDFFHDIAQFVIQLFTRPRQPHAVLGHLQTGNSNTTGIGCFTRAIENLIFQEQIHSLDRRRHVCSFGNNKAAIIEQGLCITALDLVLCGTGKCNLAGDMPRPLAFVIFTAKMFRILADTPPADVFQLFHIRELFSVNTLGIVDKTGRIRQGNHFRAQVESFFHRILSHITRTRDHTNLSLEGVATAVEHFFSKIDAAIAGSFGADQAAAKGQPLAGEHAGELIGDTLILAEEIADLARAYTDITGWDITVLADVAEELGHKRLTETHHLHIRLAFWVKVRPALGTTHRQCRQAVFKNLLKSEKFQDAQTHRRVIANPAFVRPDRIVELHAVAAVNANIPVVIHPVYPEDDDPVRLGHPLENFGILVLAVVLHKGHDRFGDLIDRLVKFRFTRIPFLDILHELLHFSFDCIGHG